MAQAQNAVVIDMGTPAPAAEGTGVTAAATAPPASKTNDTLFGPNIGVLGGGPEWAESPDKSQDVLTPEVVKGWIAKSKQVSSPVIVGNGSLRSVNACPLGIEVAYDAGDDICERLTLCVLSMAVVPWAERCAIEGTQGHSLNVTLGATVRSRRPNALRRTQSPGGGEICPADHACMLATGCARCRCGHPCCIRSPGTQNMFRNTFRGTHPATPMTFSWRGTIVMSM